MNVTGITIRHLINEPDLKAIVSIILDNEIVIHDVRIMQKEGNMFLLYPNHRYKDRNRGVVYPINKDTQVKLQQAVISEYNAAMQRLNEKRNYNMILNEY